MKILYALTSFFPFGRAYASRALNISRALRDAGHEVSVFCDYICDEINQAQGKTKNFEGISVYSTFSTPDARDSLVRRLTISQKGLKALSQLLAQVDFDLVVSSSSSDRFAGVLRLTNRYNIPLVLETCEWFDSYSWTFGRFDPRHWQSQKCRKKYYPKANAVIAISRLLEKVNRENGLPVMRMPTVLDILNMDYRSSSNDDCVKLIFAGDISTGKDRLIEAIEAVRNYSYARRVTLDVYGPTLEEVIAQSEGSLREEELIHNENIQIHGFRPQSEINQRCVEADFGLILRPDRRSSHAGFPTKLAEYMAAGTPVIANDTGDIGVFLSDGIDGFILENIQTETIVALLKKIADMTSEELSAMRRATRIVAEENFDYRKYKDSLSEFLVSVKNRF